MFRETEFYSGIKVNEKSFPFKVLEKMYGEKSRHFHTMNHIQYMMDFASKSPNFTMNVAFAIMYHDAIYIPGAEGNELASASFFKAMWENGEASDLFTGEKYLEKSKYIDADKIFDLILATKYHRFTGDTENDLLMEADLLKLHTYHGIFTKNNEELIRKEFENVSLYKYLNGRVEFLKNLRRTLEEDGVLISYEKSIDSCINYLTEELNN